MRRAAALAIAVIFGSSDCFAAPFSGRVVDASGAVVSHATVTLKSLNGGGTVSTTTGPDGRFLFGNILPGNYRVELSSPGFKKLVEPVNLAQSGMDREFTLFVASGQLVTVCSPWRPISQPMFERADWIPAGDISRFKLPPPYSGKISVRPR